MSRYPKLDEQLMEGIRILTKRFPLEKLAVRLDEFADVGQRRYKLTFAESTQYFQAFSQSEAQEKATSICGKETFKLERI
jgi:hypothetical protein